MTNNIRSELVNVKLRVHTPLSTYPGRASDYFVAVVGPGLQLGFDDPMRAPRCKSLPHSFWQKDLWLPKDSTVHYKFLVVRKCTGAVIDIESILPHQIYIGQKPIIAEHTYNKPTLIGKEVHEENNGPVSLVGKYDTFNVPCINIPPSDQVSYVVPKIENPPKYTPPRNIGAILHKIMTPITHISAETVEKNQPTMDTSPQKQTLITETKCPESAQETTATNEEEKKSKITKIASEITKLKMMSFYGHFQIKKESAAVASAGLAIGAGLAYFVLGRK